MKNQNHEATVEGEGGRGISSYKKNKRENRRGFIDLTLVNYVLKKLNFS